MVKGDRKKEEEKGRREKRRGNKDERGGEGGRQEKDTPGRLPHILLNKHYKTNVNNKSYGTCT